MKKLLHFISWQKLVLLLIFTVLVYQSRLIVSQWLIGWDSVMPELDWKLNFTRVFAGAWQEYQGLGLTGGMAHLADAPRISILWALHFVTPADYLRWSWHIAMLLLGPIGIWYLGKKVWRWNENQCLVASVFYLLNLATVQYFFVPYESFSSFYGFLPWLIAVFLMYLESGKTSDLCRLAIVSLVATSAFYVQTLFVVYSLVLGVLSFGYIKHWRRTLLGFLTVFLVNSFWLLPVIYAVTHGGELVRMAKINSIGSPETSLMNRAFGSWQNVDLLKGYWLEYIEWVSGNEWGRLMQTWYEWSKQVWVMWIGQALFGVGIGGLLWAFVKRQVKWVWLGGLLLAYMMVASFNKPFGMLYQLLVDKIPLFGEMFRSPFTKWSIVLAFFVSIGLGNLIGMIKNKLTTSISVLLIVICSVIVVWPAFMGGVISDKMKVELPSSYSKLFEFLKSQSLNGRIVYLPSQDMWSWKYTNWGYRGSGFLWYGIEQPILDRAFDVWSPYNETFYNQFSTALYGGNKDEVARVLAQYDVGYVLLDESIIAPGQDKEILRIEVIKEIARELGWREAWHEGFLTIWDTDNQTNQFVSAPSTYTFVQAETLKTRTDHVYQDLGTYVVAGRAVSAAHHDEIITYPLTDLMKEEVKQVTYTNNSTVIQRDMTGKVSGELVIPGWKVGEIVAIQFENDKPLPAYYLDGQPGPLFLGKEKPQPGKNYLVARISGGKEWGEYLGERRFTLQGETLKVEIPVEPRVYDFEKEGQGSVGNCDVLHRGVATKVGNTYMADDHGSICDYVVMSDLDTRLSYVMRVQGEDVLGRSLKFFLYNTGSKRNDLEYLMNTEKFDQSFSLIPWAWDGFYTLNIETRSFGEKTENIVAPVEVRWLPLDQLTRATFDSRLQKPDARITNDLKITEVEKTGTWLYRVKVEGSGLLRLSQGYDDGWISLGLPHVKVDGWANGWLIPESGTVTMFYWPQLLEYLGFGFLGMTVLWLILSKKN